MTKKIIPMMLLAAGAFVACKDEEKPAEVKPDTIVKTDTMVKTVTQEVDTNAILAFYAAQSKNVDMNQKVATKNKGNKKVTAYSAPIFATTDVLEKPAAPATSAEPNTKAPDTVVKIVHDVQMYYFIPDEKASFPGGEKAFSKYLLDNLEYPEKALEAGVSRTVYPTLYLDEQGHPEKVEFRYEPTIYGFQDEARRILMKSPRWNPAKVGGKPVKSKFTIPIVFKIQ